MKLDLYSAFLETQGRFTITFLHTTITLSPHPHTSEKQQPPIAHSVRSTRNDRPPGGLHRALHYTQDRVPHSHTYSHIHQINLEYSIFWTIYWDIHVFGLWEETGVPGGKPRRHRENMETSPR
ncbi:hypothetical protein MHYP_G00135990 [Metynnis hypsauchen]